MEQSKIPNLDGLTELANRDGVDIKPTLLRVMTDLYVQKPRHSDEEERHYTELALRLVDQVDAATRTIVADRLAKYPTAPQAVMQRLSRGRIERSEAAPSPPPATSGADPFAGGGATSAELSELFLAASADERRLILLNLGDAPLPAAAAIPRQTAEEAIRRLEMAALGHNSESFAQEVERSLGIARALGRRLIEDNSGEPILVVAMALNMPADVLQRILLCLNPVISQSVLRVYELSTLYEEIEPKSALCLIALWRAAHQPAQRPVAQSAAHQPQYWHDASKDQQPALTQRPTIRWEHHAQRHKAEG